jgi:protein SCO1/2
VSSGSRFETILWGVLVAVIAAISFRFATSTQRPPLPVLSQLRDFRLTNQLAEPVTLDSVRGQVGVYNVIFSRCPGQCHQLSEQMKALQVAAPAGIRLFSLTADPNNDTPAVLSKYGIRYGAEPGRWQLLTGSKRDVYQLAVSNLLFSVVDNSGSTNVPLDQLFIHSTDFAIVDRAGRLRRVVHGEEPDALPRILETCTLLSRER